MDNGGYGIAYSKCGNCGKRFIPAPMHVYRHNKKLICTWTCLCEARRKEAALKPKKLRGEKPTVRESQTIERKLNMEVKQK